MEILFLAHRAPFPPDRGDRIRSWHVLRHLARRHRVHLVALDEHPAAPPPELVGALAGCVVLPRSISRARAAAAALATGRPVSLAAFRHSGIAAAVDRVCRDRRIDAVYVFSGQMAQYLLKPGPPAIVDLVDVDSVKFAQMGEGGGLLSAVYRREAKLLGAFERQVAAQARSTLFVAQAEADLFRAGGGGGDIHVVPNGIDAARYDPALAFDRPPEAADIVFTGQMDYAPNVDAVTWFVREVLPLVRRSHAGVRFAIVGRSPTPAVRALAGQGVIVTGEVADTRPWLAAARVAVAPLRLARGVQNKVLEAMAMAIPVVATAAAATGIDHGGTVAVADTAAEMADAVSALLADPARTNARGAAGRRRVLDLYDWDSCLRPLDTLLAQAAA